MSALSEFIRKVTVVTDRDTEVHHMIGWISEGALRVLQEGAVSFDDPELNVAIIVLARYYKMSRYSNEHADIRPEVFIEALVHLVPIVISSKLPSVANPKFVVSRLTEMATHVSTSRTGTADTDVLRGYALMVRLGYADTHVDGVSQELRWLGQRFDLIAAHWPLFEERGILDKDFIAELESAQDGSRSLMSGIL